MLLCSIFVKVSQAEASRNVWYERRVQVIVGRRKGGVVLAGSWLRPHNTTAQFLDAPQTMKG